MSGPKEQRCEYCGEPMGVFAWSRRVDGPLSCGAVECNRYVRDEERGALDEARQAAEADGFAAYRGGGW